MIFEQDVTWYDNGKKIGGGTLNLFTKKKTPETNIPVDLNNTFEFPPFDFFNDIQDIIRVFIGGEAMTQSKAHKPIYNLDKSFEKILKRGYAEKVIFDVNELPKYIRADLMLDALYISRIDPGEHKIYTFNVDGK